MGIASTITVGGSLTPGGEHYHGLVTAEGTGSGDCEKGFNIGGSDGTHHRFTGDYTTSTSNGGDNLPGSCTRDDDGEHTHSIAGITATLSGDTQVIADAPANDPLDVRNEYAAMPYFIKVL